MSSTAKSEPKSNRLLAWFGIVGVVIMTAVGTWLRVEIAISDPLWLDELHTSWVVSGDLGNVAPRAVMGNQTPTYFWWVYAVISTGGQSPFTLRFISIVTGSVILLVGGLYVLFRTKSTAAALITTSLLAFDSNLLFYATEARPYALLQLVALLPSLFVVELICCQPNDCDPNQKCLVRVRAVVWIAILCAFALAIHPTAILFVPAIIGTLGVGWLMRSKQQIKRDVTAADPPGSLDRLASGPGAVIFVVGLIVALGVGLWFLISPTIEMAWSRRGLWSSSSDWQSLAWRGACLVLICGLVPWLLIMRANRWRSAGTSLEIQPGLSRASVVLLSIFMMTIACATLLDVSQIASLATERYAALVWPLVSVGAGLVAGTIRQSLFRLVAIVALPNLIWFLSSAASIGVEFSTSRLLLAGEARILAVLRRGAELPTFRHEDWKSAVESIWPGAPVYLMSNIIEDDLLASATHSNDTKLLEYLAFPVSGIYQLSSDAKIFPKATHARNRFSNEDCQEIKKGIEYFSIIRGSKSTVDEIFDDLKSSLQNDFPSKEIWYFSPYSYGDVWVVRFEIKDPSMFGSD